MIKKRLIAMYENRGHYMYPEDTWTKTRVINNEDELYDFMVEIHKADARTRNNFPFCGLCDVSNFTFFLERYVEIDGEMFLSKKTENTDIPDYFEKAFDRYHELIVRAKKTLPKLREANKKREQEEKDIKYYLSLKEKYEKSLDVKVKF